MSGGFFPGGVCPRTKQLIDDNPKGGLTQFWELLIVIPCAPKDFKR